MDFPPQQTAPARLVSPDEVGEARDHDRPYRFGRRPRASAPYPFSTRQYARLLILRGRFRDLPNGEDGPCDGSFWPPAAA